MPGGKIAVYTGMLEITKNVNGLAAVMGHEIAHAVARHSAERMSTAILMDAGTYALEKFVLGQRLPRFSKQLRTSGLDLPMLWATSLHPYDRRCCAHTSSINTCV